MSTRDLHTNIKTVLMMVPIVVNNDTEGTPSTGLDCREGDANEIILAVGDSGDTLSGSLKHDVIAEDSNDNSTFTAITDANALLLTGNKVASTLGSNGIIYTIDDPAEDQIVVRCGYLGSKRYFRLRVDTTGTHTNGTPMSMVGIQSRLHNAPVKDA
jgi:hypothetical protein